ncbi:MULTISPECIES: aminotransferase class V-fold PLP-dependent enzyme [Planktothricoides]|uniref:Aminotransferase class V-fold PLP-dependent enzyme n=1 Tax=Planktothricoides raciborskii FACHB-1370 TaxID=2949576 RepID=A0ABR8EGV9_9CYAN|nr:MULTISPECIES: aminotransferase class V-fold PLP-dependent enzyme [Planktothricoides]KOR36971.1 cysteine lyase [Planktothricoides sp. SR001]MBD2545324.1 aminotransferase class V-fold PLP-dependent enzyme [Planktothricoides raciborskii FACHB-1370]MBD2584390.1 aminotransferase class V-fold PLP-dependent enzyme [Planktothricoides raciborskii FACHB-1261]
MNDYQKSDYQKSDYQKSDYQKSGLDLYRSQFPGLKNKAYFNYGGQGVMPQQALNAIADAHTYLQEIGPYSESRNQWVAAECYQTRKAIAAELGVAPETIAFTENTTGGCNIALWGLDWQPSDHLLMTDSEHPGVIAAIEEIQRRFKIEVSICPLIPTLNQGDVVEVISQYLRPNTRLLVISHILWNTGQLLPLDRIMQLFHNVNQQPEHRGFKNKIKVLVDAAQSVGVLPLNLPKIGVDFYSFTGHKWWGGPGGVGGLYIHPDAQNNLHPTFIGWRGLLFDAAENPLGWKPDARKFELATSAYPLYTGLREAIALHHQWGNAQERYQKILQLSAYLWQKLTEIPGITCLRHTAPESGLVSFQIEPKRLNKAITYESLSKTLETNKIIIRTIPHPHCFRACVHYFTLESEIDRLVSQIKEIIH